MKICIYCESLRTATSGTPMRAMIRELLELRSGDHFLLSVRKGYRQDPVLTAFFASLQHLKNWELVEEPLSRKLSNALGLLRYKHYCSISTKADIYLNPDCNSLGAHAHPLIVVITDLSSFRSIEYTSYKKNWQVQLRRFMMSNAINQAEQVVAISQSTARGVMERFPSAAARTTVVYNGLQPEWFSTASPMHPGKRYWIWWGSISARKNLGNLLRAYHSLKKEIDDIPKLLFIYSNQQLPEEFTALMKELELGNSIQLERSKPLHELIDLVSGSSGLVFPSHVEGFGMPVIESFSRGVPVLTSSTTSLIEVANGLGILVDPEDVSSIKNGLKKLSELKEDKAAMQTRQQWAARFTHKEAARQFSELIDSNLAKKVQHL
jgi:glycosyltransferase involved in cell wall biosynthesis